MCFILRHIKTADHRVRVKGAWGTALASDIVLVVVDAHRQAKQADPRIARMLRGINAGLRCAPASATDAAHPPDGAAPTSDAVEAVEAAGDGHMPKALVLNKIDLIPKQHRRAALLDLKNDLNKIYKFDETFFVSAKYQTGTDKLLAFVRKHSQPGGWEMPANAKTNLSNEDLAKEIVREEVFRRLYKELPYVAEVVGVSYSKGKEVVKIQQARLR